MDETTPTLDDFVEYYNWLKEQGDPVAPYLEVYYNSYMPLQGENTKLVVMLNGRGEAVSFMWVLPDMDMYSDSYFTYEGPGTFNE